MNPPSRARLIAYWITTVFGPASFVIGGVAHLSRSAQPVEMAAHLGYPPYILTILGVWKLAGAIVTVIPGVPRLKEWAYAGFFCLLTSASASHVLHGDPLVAAGPFMAAPPLLFLAIVMASWALRPPSRRLPDAAVTELSSGR